MPDGAAGGSGARPGLAELQTRLMTARAGTGASDTSQPDIGVTVRPHGERPGDATRLLAQLAELEQLPSDDDALPIEIEGTLGEGGMGVVRLAVQRSLGRRVAAKTLRPGDRTDADVLRLLREAWVTGAVEHPNVVPVHDVRMADGGRPVIVLKRIEGEVWSQLLRDPERLQRRIDGDPLEWHLRTLIQVCRALEYAHRCGIVHRDLKPENVMVGEFGEVYLLDWGIAVSLRDDGSGRVPLAAQADSLAGTPAYMAPEMLGGQAHRLSERTDVYLLGSTLYEIISGYPPHRGASLESLLENVLRSSPPLPPGAPEELAAICRRAMAAEPAERFADAGGFRQAIETFLRHRASAEVARQAAESFERLQQLLGSAGEGDEADRAEVYRSFGACRFGFLHALSTWPENPAAQTGGERALAAMADYELRLGNARSAEVFLEEMREPDPALLARIEAGRAAERAERERVAALERLQQDLDVSRGSRGRAVFGAAAGLVWMLSPVVGQYRAATGSPQEPFELLFWPGVLFSVVCVFGWWAREDLLRTAVNRRLFVAVALAMGGAFLCHVGLLSLGQDVHVCQVMDLLLWAIVSAGVAATVDRRFFLSAFGYLVGFGVAVFDPSLRYYVFFLANAGTTAVFVSRWRSLQRDASDSPGAEAA